MNILKQQKLLIKNLQQNNMAKLTRNVNYCNYRWEEYVLTDEELKRWKTGDEDIQQDIIDDADWDLVRDKPIDDYGDVEFVEE